MFVFIFNWALKTFVNALPYNNRPKLFKRSMFYGEVRIIALDKPEPARYKHKLNLMRD